jgi:hypothetical protein
LRSYFRKRGVAVSSTTLGAVLLTNSVQAAPASWLSGWPLGNSVLATLVLRRLLWQKFVSVAIPVVLVLLIGGLLARLTLVAEKIAQADAAARVAATNQQQAIAREARAVVTEIDRGLFFNDPQAFAGSIHYRNLEEEGFRPLLAEYARVSNEFRTALAAASPTRRAPSRTYRMILEEVFKEQPAPGPTILTPTYATDNAFRTHAVHLVKTNGAWRWDFFAAFSPEVRAHRMAVLDKKISVMRMLLPALRNGSLTNAYEALDQFKAAE